MLLTAKDFYLMMTRREFFQRTMAAGLAAAASSRIAHAAKVKAGKDEPKPAPTGLVETVLGPLANCCEQIILGTSASPENRISTASSPDGVTSALAHKFTKSRS